MATNVQCIGSIKHWLSISTWKWCLLLLVMHKSQEWSWNTEEEESYQGAAPSAAEDVPFRHRPGPWSWLRRHRPAQAVPGCQHARLGHLHMSSARHFTESFKGGRAKWKLLFIAIILVPSSVSVFSKKEDLICKGYFNPLLWKSTQNKKMYLVII